MLGEPKTAIIQVYSSKKENSICIFYINEEKYLCKIIFKGEVQDV